MEEVDGVVWGNIAAVARVPRQATWEPLAALCLWGPTAGYWEVEEKMSYYSGTSKCALSRSPWLCFVWLQLAPLQKAEGKFWQRHVGARCYSRPDGGQPFTRFTLASSCPRRSAQGAWLDDTAKLLCNCRREKPTIGISPSATRLILSVLCRLAVEACEGGSVAKMSRRSCMICTVPYHMLRLRRLEE